MESLKNINQEKLEIISKFNEKELMLLINNLSKKYYSHYVDGDIDKCKSTIAFIEDVVFMFEDDMKFIYEFVNYSLLKHANIVIKTLYRNNDYDLECYDVDIEKVNPMYSLNASIRNSMKLKIDNVDKVNIKNLHDIVANDESIDDNVVVLVNALYDSFLAKVDDESGDCE